LAAETSNYCKDCPTCFPAGTKITMADGLEKNIEDVRVGDFIMSYDETQGKNVAAEVLELESPVRYHLYTLTFEDGRTLRLTSEHPLYARGKGWASIDPEATYNENEQAVGKLEIGDDILDVGSSWAKILNITFEELPRGVQTYNLKKINGYRNFYADGFLVHNKNWFSECWDVVEDAWDTAGEGLELVGDVFSDWGDIDDDWEDMWDGVGDTFSSVGDVFGW